MRRIRLFLTVAVIMAMLSALTAAPALASHDDDWWGWIDVDEVTDVDFDDGVWEFEGVGEIWGQPAEFEWVCDWWGSCWLVDVDFL